MTLNEKDKIEQVVGLLLKCMSCESDNVESRKFGLGAVVKDSSYL